MKQFWKDVILSCILGFLVPGAVLSVGVAMFDGAQNQTEETVAQVQQEYHQNVCIPVLLDNGEVVEMEMNDYLTGVVLAEMPASFEQEAQKAQAVVARTYTVRAWKGKSKHENAAVCTDSTCCQGYVSCEAYLNRGGSQEGVDRIRAAVEATDGMVLVYEGELVEATYFSCSGGTTEDAVAVWGTDVPYLRSVESPGEEDAAYYSDSVSFSSSELGARLSREMDTDPKDWFSNVTYTAGGGVNTIDICGVRYEGTELRKLLGLRSTAFSVTVTGDTITFTTRGYGHRVGMSQYGADAMARLGASYDEILAHYYQGTHLSRMTD